MIISAEVKCRTCDLVFCCAKCRLKHEDGNHPEMAMIRKICYICNNRPFPLRRDTVISPNNLLLAHVFKEHLPLRCNSCTQLFLSPDDFQKIGKCFQFCPTAAAEKHGGCLLESQQEGAKKPVPVRRTTVDDDEEKENVELATAVIVPAVAEPKQRPQKRRSIPPSGDLYPVPEPQQEEVDEALLTPLTKINLRWKRKSRQSFDSMLSTTANNNSSTLESNRVADVTGQRPKLVRSTSTPMYQWQILPSMKVSNDSFTATLGQMSSIHCSSGSDTDSRADDICSPPPSSVPLQAPPPEIVVAEPSPAEDFHKVRAIIRNQSKAAATPLRQVMSKSIQRAIAQHTQHTRQQQHQQLGAYSKMLQPGTQRKMSFSSTISSVGNDSSHNSTIASPVPDPLDLRTTPAMKRDGKEARTKPMATVQTTIGSNVNKVQHPVDEHETEYYETHRDLESLRAADESTAAERENRENNWKLHADGRGGLAQQANRSYERTPKSSGTLLKKVISFHGISTVAPADKNDTKNEADEEDVWGTPCAVVPPMRSYSCSAVGLGNTFQTASSLMEPVGEAYPDDVFSASAELNVPKEKLEMGDGKIVGPVGANGGGSRLWSIVSNVIRLASRSDVLQENSPQPATESSVQSVGGGIVRRAMSFADYLKTRYSGEHGGAARRTSSSGSDEYRVAAVSNCKKRKRVTSVYASRSAYSAVSGNGPPPVLPSVTKVTYSPAAKRKRIQARQPIHRLRYGSDDSGSN
ncbi:mitosis initiation protein fs(1)Ya-like [Anopheles albimanus]|uniref:mitosis initiation protein fs(1)Ya-like n=1 Tax=Anopheles albimanus TaxID=7167 RepID=UPI001640F30F|nr:mitosis initiation protein fs(1)Ya-like [Anopheles albimanus]